MVNKINQMKQPLRVKLVIYTIVSKNCQDCERYIEFDILVSEYSRINSIGQKFHYYFMSIYRFKCRGSRKVGDKNGFANEPLLIIRNLNETISGSRRTSQFKTEYLTELGFSKNVSLKERSTSKIKKLVHEDRKQDDSLY